MGKCAQRNRYDESPCHFFCGIFKTASGVKWGDHTLQVEEKLSGYMFASAQLSKVKLNLFIHEGKHHRKSLDDQGCKIDNLHGSLLCKMICID